MSIKVIEWLFFAMFALDYLLRLFVAESRLAYVFSAPAVIDLLSILPILSLASSAKIGFLRILRVFRILRILRGYRSVGAEGANSDEGVSRQIAYLGFFMVSTIFIGAGAVHSLELFSPGSFHWPATENCDWDVLADQQYYDFPEECQMDFFQAVYFLIITVTTVGFGDMYPLGHVGRFVILGILVPLFVMVPQEIAKLNDLLEKQSKFSAGYKGTSPHVVVVGDVQFGVARSFLHEFFHPDHGDQKCKVLFLRASEPSGALAALVTDQSFADRVQYIRGSPLTAADLQKAKLADSSAVFVLTSQFNLDALTTDATSVLIVKAIKSVCPWVPVFCQLVSPRSTIHTWANWDTLVCIEELKMGIMARSCLCPGFSTLIANLIESSSEVDISALPRADRRWIREYLDGYGQEVYCMELSEAFSGMLFSVVVNKCYNLFGVCIFGIETRASKPRAAQAGSNAIKTVFSGAGRVSEPVSALQQDLAEATGLDNPLLQSSPAAATKPRAGTRTLINPKDYIVRAGDKAFLIADDASSAMRVQEWDGKVERPTHRLLAMLSITPAEKSTFRRLNNNLGPFLKSAEPKMLGNAHAIVQFGPTSSSSRGTPGLGSPVLAAATASALPDPGLLPPAAVSLPSSPSAAMTRRGSIKPGQAKVLDKRASPGSAAIMAKASIAAAKAGKKEDKFGEAQPVLPHTRIVLDAGELSGHIILCGAAAMSSALPHFLRYLRASSVKPVLVLHPDAGDPVPIPHDLPNVFFMSGSSLDLEDLARAGANTASVAVVLANPEEAAEAAMYGGSDGPDAGLGSLSGDIESVFTVCVIEANFPSCRTLVEVVDNESMRFLNFKPVDDGLPHALWPQYCAGRVYTASMLDTLLCQAFYNPSLVPVLKRLIGGSSADDEEADDEDSDEPAEAKLPGARPHERYEQHCHVVQMRVPLPYRHRPYRDLFMELMLTRNMLPIGVYRCQEVHKGALLNYVVTNPPANMLLHEEDKVFVLVGEKLLAEATRNFTQQVGPGSALDELAVMAKAAAAGAVSGTSAS